MPRRGALKKVTTALSGALARTSEARNGFGLAVIGVKVSGEARLYGTRIWVEKNSLLELKALSERQLAFFLKRGSAVFSVSRQRDRT